MNTRNLFAISIKHSIHGWKLGKPLVLWGTRKTADDERRRFGGYSVYPKNAEVYSLQDWQNSGYSTCSWMKLDTPVKFCLNFCKKFKKYDTVLMEVEDYMAYCKLCGIPLEQPDESKTAGGAE